MTVAKGEYFEFSRISGSHVELHPIELWRRNYKSKTKEEVFVTSYLIMRAYFFDWSFYKWINSIYIISEHKQMMLSLEREKSVYQSNLNK